MYSAGEATCGDLLFTKGNFVAQGTGVLQGI